jgi:hypothetical protein
LCQDIYRVENRRIITCSDIEKSENCSTIGTYSKNFRKHLGITLRNFVLSLGFDMPKSGLGMIYEFDDGEVTTSKYEYDTSVYFRENNIKYERNVKYKSFINGYFGNKDCDYAILNKNTLWYVEIAGMLKNSNTDELYSDKIHEKYRLDLIDKVKMLESENLKYKIVYPSDFKNGTIEEIFSFLHSQK